MARLPAAPWEETYNQGFCARVQLARLTQGPNYTQKLMSGILGVSLAAYQKYEIRTPMPHYLIERFARITGASIDWLITGKGKGPVSVTWRRSPPFKL